MQKVIVGLDIGGTKILSGIITPDGQIIARKKEPTGSLRDTREILNEIAETVRELMHLTKVEPGDILGVAVGAPGPLDYRNGVIKDPPNLMWRDLPLRDELSKRLGKQLLLDNDANLAALGEWKFSKSKAGRHLIYLTVSTGIGGGIIIDGELYRGRDGGAGEFGRMMFETETGQGSASVIRCLEDLASGTAMASQAGALHRLGRGQAIMKFCAPDSPITAAEIGAAARQGVPEALEIVTRAGRYLGLAIANLVNVFNPDRIVIGGGTGLGLQDLWADQLQVGMEDGVAPSLGHGLKIEFTTLGEDIGLLGCAAAVLHELEKTGKISNTTFAFD